MTTSKSSKAPKHNIFKKLGLNKNIKSVPILINHGNQYTKYKTTIIHSDREQLKKYLSSEQHIQNKGFIA